MNTDGKNINDSKWGILIQCRTSSTRLPKKALKNIYREQTLIEIIYFSLLKFLPNYLAGISSLKDTIFFIIPDNEEDLENFLIEKEIPYLTGHPSNVLLRYHNCAKKLKIEKIIRLTADNPWYDLKVLSDLIIMTLSGDADYYAIKGLMFGTAGEAFTLNSLERCLFTYNEKLTDDDYEHVSLFIKKNPTLFQIRTETYSNQNFSHDIRLTIDYPDDLERIRRLIKKVKNPFDVSNKEMDNLYRNDPTLFK
jgi:spore coat polysaccharide biosynthesis protein SpsF